MIATQPTETVLELRDVNAWYGESHVLHGVTFQIQRGEVISLLGRNGAGRTTVLRSILGLAGRSTGSVRIHGKEMGGMESHHIARAGVGYCPEERGIFSSLSCEENLLLPPRLRGKESYALSVDDLYAMFPNLAERRHSPGTKLSGGEQQMLAIARILRTGADILLLDEISEGLAPVIVKMLAHAIRTLKERGYTIVMVEQNFRFAAPLADRSLIIEHGHIVESFTQAELRSRLGDVRRYLGV